MPNIVALHNPRGFTRMDNSLMEALATVDLPARELRVLMAIARQTIGYQLETKRLTADDIGKQTNLRRDVTSKAISHLLEPDHFSRWREPWGYRHRACPRVVFLRRKTAESH